MVLKGIILIEVSQTGKKKKTIPWFHLPVESKINKKKQNKTERTNRYRYREQTGDCQRWEGWGLGKIDEGD